MSRYMVVRTWLFRFPNVAPTVCRFENAGGWDSVDEMQAARITYYKTHPREVAEPIPGGVRIRWRSNGERHQEVTIESSDGS